MINVILNRGAQGSVSYDHDDLESAMKRTKTLRKYYGCKVQYRGNSIIVDASKSKEVRQLDKVD